MAQVFKYSPEKVREWPVPSGTLANAPVISASNQAGFTLTPRGDSTRTVNNPDGSTRTYPNGAVGQRSDSATVATDGTFSYAVTGATSGTVKGTRVYAVISGSAVTSLTLTASTNVLFGVVDSYLGKASSSDTAVRIGDVGVNAA